MVHKMQEKEISVKAICMERHLRQFHYKVWLAGIILAAAVWYQLDPVISDVTEPSGTALYIFNLLLTEKGL